MSTHRTPGVTYRWLDFCLSLPVAAPDALLERRLTEYNPGLAATVRPVRLSEMRLLTNRKVRDNIGSISAWALRGKAPYRQPNAPQSARYAHAFITAARAIRDGRQL